MSYDAIILAGGDGLRLGGTNKAEVVVGGIRLLDRVLAAASGAESIVVVGDRTSTPAQVTWAREIPAGGGPAAALAAGLAHASGETVVVLAVDLPWVTAEVVERLVAAAGRLDGAIAVDATGRDQQLLAAYRRESLSERAAGVTPGTPLRDLLVGMDLARVAEPHAARDCDTWDDIAMADEEVDAGG